MLAEASPFQLDVKKQKSNLVLHGGSKSNASNNLAKKKKYREIITEQNG